MSGLAVRLPTFGSEICVSGIPISYIATLVPQNHFASALNDVRLSSVAASGLGEPEPFSGMVSQPRPVSG
jgi:hypothetical protein